ncbi:MAG: pyridoxamine 5'-phosphate oxidase family protein [Bryobacterales bacterium]|nr:pyridoxamine 5'-phosphate oxidase family protein [Bryobacterales bacterium]
MLRCGAGIQLLFFPKVRLSKPHGVPIPMTLLSLRFVLLSTIAAQPAPQSILDAARAVMQSAEFCFLVTVDDTTEPHARLMQPFPPDEQMRVFLGTNPNSRKIAQLRKNPRTTLAYYDKAGPNYVTLTGTSRIVDTPSERRKHWRKEWQSFFPGGPGGPNYTVIEFTPQRIELISTTHKIAIEPTSPPAIIHRTPSGWSTRK